MSAIMMKGTVVSVERYVGKTREGKGFSVDTCYVVNGGGRPEALKIMNIQSNPYKPGTKIEVPVRANLFKNEVTYQLIEE